jgi:hypothetical protein
MNNRRFVKPLIAGMFALVGMIPAADAQVSAGPAQSGQRMQSPPPLYGSQLMTPQERSAYQARMRAAHTQQERDQIRAEHHREMQERARAQGYALPDQPRGPGMGPGMGPAMPPGY